MVRGGWAFIMAIGSRPMAITTTRLGTIRAATQTIAMGQLPDIIVTTRAVGLVQVQSIILPRGLTPGSMILSPVVNVTQTAQL